MGTKNKPQTAQDLIDQILKDQVIRAGYSAQPTAGERIQAQRRLVALIEDSGLSPKKLAKVLSQIAVDDKRVTKVLSKSKPEVREALAGSSRPLTNSARDNLVDDPEIYVQIAYAQARADLTRDEFEEIFEEALNWAYGEKDPKCQAFVKKLMQSDQPLPDDLWGNADPWSGKLKILKVPGMKVVIAGSGRKDTPERVIEGLLRRESEKIDLAFAGADFVPSRKIFDVLSKRGSPEVVQTMNRNPAFATFRDAPVRHLELAS